MQISELFVDAKDGSKICGLHPSTLRKLAAQRRIRSFKILGALRFRRVDLENLVVERPAKSPVRAENPQS